ncbi:NADPH-dependent oxidoreductase [Robertkochia marina]|uniref:NADPH-dependent oxidoreductase n=1 Tax=Robertkochia marina TaxID=1227945 RepID=A0A4S3M0P6_9FLAO|nr:NAD(P)H-dependent oxidoreductase [Robertkochia marina]THD67758.1 NADPH-dependent oxidoreductase [Robertkochia marina]TRZ40923.1 NADPH-dependent oxidoreductase [Robertkochia marina]
MKILAFAGSNSSTSINYQLVKYTVSLIKGHEIQLYNMANMPFPMYSADAEKNDGFKNSLVEFKDEIQKADKIILSVNEHNGGPSAYFKNLLDWLSRLDKKFADGASIFLMSTSPGKGGAQSSRSYAEKALPWFGATIEGTFSLPSFNHTFDINTGSISNEELKAEHQQKLEEFLLS